jgi:predicted  nucleic acid-binding Zn-ribbon protein
MNNGLQNIIDLSNLDKNNTSWDNQKATLRIKLNELLSKKEAILLEVEAISEKVQSSNLNIRKNNTYLAELNAQLEEITKKTAKIKTEKEAKALALEEDIAKEQIIFANDEIKRYEKIIENTEEENKSTTTALEEIEKEIIDEEAIVEKGTKSIDKNVKKTNKEKEKLVSEIDQKALAFYNKIRLWAKDTSVVPVKDQVCYGCFIQLSDQAYLDTLKQEEMKTCSHCGRILYIDEPTTSAS